MTMNFKPYITRDPSICGGEPVIPGTRITVRTTRGAVERQMDALVETLDSLNTGETQNEHA